MENVYVFISIIAIYILHEIIVTHLGKDSYRSSVTFWKIFLSLECSTSFPAIVGSSFYYSYCDYATMWCAQLIEAQRAH